MGSYSPGFSSPSSGAAILEPPTRPSTPHASRADTRRDSAASLSEGWSNADFHLPCRPALRGSCPLFPLRRRAVACFGRRVCETTGVPPGSVRPGLAQGLQRMALLEQQPGSQQQRRQQAPDPRRDGGVGRPAGAGCRDAHVGDGGRERVRLAPPPPAAPRGPPQSRKWIRSTPAWTTISSDTSATRPPSPPAAAHQP